jgi:hypothetical protein
MYHANGLGIDVVACFVAIVLKLVLKQSCYQRHPRILDIAYTNMAYRV